MDKVFAPQKKEMDSDQPEDVSKIISEWLKPEHVLKKTRYKPRQVLSISILQSLADTYKIKTLQRFLDSYRTAKLSEDGKSSEELEKILTSRMNIRDENDIGRLAKYLE